jgi:anti-sigma factor RsiW
MKCHLVQDEELAGQKMELLYGEADAPARARVEAHLAECPACREELAALGRLRGKLRAWTIDERSVAFSSRPRPLLVWLAAAAALVIGLGVGSAIALLGDAGLQRELATQEAQARDR